jgi:hypothetical protein
MSQKKMHPAREARISPWLAESDYCVTSEETDEYNCAAWAVSATDQNWWPGYPEDHYWPEDGIDSVDYFISYFKKQGFIVCKPSESDLESGFEKIALYARSDSPQHLARQLNNGKWTSKCGEWEDIEHDLKDVAGLSYGEVVKIFKRPLPTSNK